MTVIEDHEKEDSKEDRAFTNLYVKCFPPHFKEQDLSELFGGFGPIQAVKVMTDPRGRSFGFVNFEQPDDAKTCIQEMHRKDLRSRKEQKEAKKLEAEGQAPPVKFDVDGHPEHLLYVGRAQSKEERAAMFQKQYGDKGAPKGAPKGKGNGKGDSKGDGKGDGKGAVFYGGKGGVPGADTPFEAQPSPTAASAMHGTSTGPDVPLSFSGGTSSPWQQSQQQMYQPPYSNGGSYHEGDHGSYAANGCGGGGFRAGCGGGMGTNWGVGDGCGWEAGWNATGDNGTWQGSYGAGWESGCGGWGGGSYAGNAYGGCEGFDSSYGGGVNYHQPQYGLQAQRQPAQPLRKGYHWQL
eukprot:gb/GFBE01042987.1/.p1 GENE.gb/GFBE01042987.1/~~gb/GFBE01042987.1/.p1  ORF type:complete len:350 (+),score=70.59 gb/GFBE01042987.1/:1-1050(+)